MTDTSGDWLMNMPSSRQVIGTILSKDLFQTDVVYIILLCNLT